MPKSKIKKTATKTKRGPTPSQEQLLSQLAFQKKVAHLKEVVRQVFPKLEGVDSIYDAQTVVNALAGFIDAHVEKKVQDIKLSELTPEILEILKKEEDSKIKTAILELIATFPEESAQEFSESLEKFGTALGKFAADKFLKQPMSTITVDDLVQK